MGLLNLEYFFWRHLKGTWKEPEWHFQTLGSRCQRICYQVDSVHEPWLRPIVSYSQQLKFKTWLLDPSLVSRSSWRNWIPGYCNSNHFVQTASVKLAVLMRKHSAIAATGNSNLCACERFKFTDSFGDSLTRNALQANWDTDSTLRCSVELLGNLLYLIETL